MFLPSCVRPADILLSVLYIFLNSSCPHSTRYKNFFQLLLLYHFQDALENFAQELEFFYQAMCSAQEKYPVDVLYFYTPTTDLIGHCAMYCDNSDVVVKAYRLLDQYVGKWLDALQPENVIFLSDHGNIVRSNV